MKSAEGKERIQEMYADLLQDESNLAGAWCDYAAWPESSADMEEVLSECSQKGMHVTFSGGLTGIAAGALPQGGAVVSTSAMKGIEMLDASTVRAEAGVTLEELRTYLRDNTDGGTFYPPDPTEETATVGGTVSTDASGSDSFLYGSTRHWVDALEAVVPPGRTVSLKRGDHKFINGRCSHPVLGELMLPELEKPQPEKNAAGYHIKPGMDLIDLIIGSEGTLGVITRADLKLAPVPRDLIDLAVFPTSEDSFWDLYGRLLDIRDRIRLRALEMMDGRCIDFLRKHPGELPPPPEGSEFVLLLRAEANDDEAMEEVLITMDEILTDCGLDPDQAWGGFEPTERKKIKDFRHALPESVNHRIAELRRDHPGIHKFGSDGAVDPGQLKDYYTTIREILKDLNLPHLVFGHAGQGHLHANAIPEDDDALKRADEAMYLIAKAAVDMGGTISAEHGLGRIKLPFLTLMYTPGEIAGMEAIRRTIDPDHLLATTMEFPL